MKATVIGASGFIGKRLATSLELAGLDVSRPNSGEIDNLPGQDLGILYYCAGMTSNFRKEPSKTVDAHVSLVCRLLSQCRFAKVVYLSSTRLYDRSSLIAPTDLAIRENEPLCLNPLNPRHLFDITKAAGESICFAFAPEKAFVARLSCVWDTSEDSTGFIGELARQIRRFSATKDARPIQLNTKNDISRHYIHIDSVVTALQTMGTTDCEGGIFSLASDSEPTSNKEIFSVLNRTYGIEVSTSNSHDLNIKNASIADQYSNETFGCPNLDLSLYTRLVSAFSNKPKPFIDELVDRVGAIME